MSVVKINAITVPAGSGDEVARRFAARAGTVDSAEGFEGFQLLRPTDDRTTWLVVTRWRDDASFDAWRNAPAFESAHARPAGADGSPAQGQPPVAMSAELWSFELELDAGPKVG
ncbi:MAG: antibiotic biosynthesis monooxygenase [Acidimicrobiia bacterium]